MKSHYRRVRPSSHRIAVLIRRWANFPSGKEPACQCRRPRRSRFNPWVEKIPWRRKWLPIPVFLPGKFHGQRSLVGYSPWGHKGLAEPEHVHTSLRDNWTQKNAHRENTMSKRQRSG